MTEPQNDMTPGLMSGRLEGISVPDLMWALCSRRAGGVLRVSRDGVRKTVYFEDGRIVFAASSDPDDRLGELFLRQGKVGLDALDEALGKLGSGKRLGTILVEAGALSPQDLVDGVLTQVREIVLDLFTWDDGEYRFEPGPLPTREVITLQMRTGELLLRGIRRIRSFTRIRRSVGPPRTAYRLVPDSGRILDGLSLSSGEDELIGRLRTGPDTIDNLCSEVYLSNFEVYQTLWAFRVLGAVTPDDGASKTTDDPEIAGRFGRESLIPLLMELCRAEETGVLYVSRGSVERSLHLREGQVVFATSSEIDDGLVAYLLRRGVISLRDREETAKRLLSNKRVGTILREMGVIDDVDLRTMVREQLAEVVQDTLAWSGGEYAFVPGELPTIEEITLEASVESLVAAAIRRIQSWTRVRDGVGGAERRLALGPDFLSVLDRMRIGPAEWEVVTALKDPKTVAQVCKETGLGDFQVTQILWALCELGAAKSAEVEETAEESQTETVGRVEETVSPSMVRTDSAPSTAATDVVESTGPALSSDPSSSTAPEPPAPSFELATDLETASDSDVSAETPHEPSMQNEFAVDDEPWSRLRELTEAEERTVSEPPGDEPMFEIASSESIAPSAGSDSNRSYDPAVVSDEDESRRMVDEIAAAPTSWTPPHVDEAADRDRPSSVPEPTWSALEDMGIRGEDDAADDDGSHPVAESDDPFAALQGEPVHTEHPGAEREWSVEDEELTAVAAVSEATSIDPETMSPTVSAAPEPEAEPMTEWNDEAEDGWSGESWLSEEDAKEVEWDRLDDDLDAPPRAKSTSPVVPVPEEDREGRARAVHTSAPDPGREPVDIELPPDPAAARPSVAQTEGDGRSPEPEPTQTGTTPNEAIHAGLTPELPSPEGVGPSASASDDASGATPSAVHDEIRVPVAESQGVHAAEASSDPVEHGASAGWEPPTDLEDQIARLNARQRVLYRTIRAEIGAGAVNFVRSCCGKLGGEEADAFVDAELRPDGTWDSDALRRAVLSQRIENPAAEYDRLLEMEFDLLRIHIGEVRAQSLREQLDRALNPPASP